MLDNVYISLTSIKGNETALIHTLKSIQNQSQQPDKCFIYLSEEPYILDKGFKEKRLNKNLEQLINSNPLFEVRWVKNTGPYRKLLPLLEEKFKENCAIIAIDDDTSYEPDMIQKYINDYKEYDCVIGSRSFTMNVDNLDNISYKDKVKLDRLNLYNFHTGKGGVLYHPKFFKKSATHLFDENLYTECCPHGDDIWFNFHRIANGIKCWVAEITFTKKGDHTTTLALYRNFNMINDNNTKHMRKTIIKLKELGYKI